MGRATLLAVAAVVVAATVVAASTSHVAETLTLCEQKCAGACFVYHVPVGSCFEPQKLWPGDAQWTAGDTLDTVLNATFLRRAFFASSNGQEALQAVSSFSGCGSPPLSSQARVPLSQTSLTSP